MSESIAKPDDRRARSISLSRLGRIDVPAVDGWALARRVVAVVEHHVTWIALAASVVVVYALYGRALGFAFFFDDTFDLTRVEGRSYWQLLSSSEGYSYYRPIPFLIWKALRDTQGHYDQATLHALPLIAHAVAGWCLFLLLRRLGAGLWAAFPALLFLTFPFHYQNIAIVGTLFHPLTGAAMLGSLVLYERARARDVVDRDGVAGGNRENFATRALGRIRRVPLVILSRSEGSPRAGNSAVEEERSFAAAQDDKGRRAVLWHIAALMATVVALWAHESGVVVAGLIVLLEAVVLWRRGERRPSPWVAAHVLAALLFFVTWLTVEKDPFTDKTSLDELQPKALFFLQGFTWPLSAQTYWIQDNIGIPGGVTIATIGLLDVGVFALMLGIAAYTISAWRTRHWDLLAIPAFSVLIGVGASAPSIWRLSWDYVENSPRLLYLVAIGASIFWGLLPALRFGNERLTMWWRVVSSALLLLVVVQSWRFVDVRLEMWETGTRVVNDVVAAGESYEGRHILVVNAPAWFAQGIYEYPYGHFGVQLMPEYIGLDRVIYTSSPRSPSIDAESKSWNPDTGGGRFGFGPHGVAATPEEIDGFLREGYELIEVRPVGNAYVVRDVGRIQPGDANPELAHAGVIGDALAVSQARIAASDGALTIFVDWHVLDQLADSVALVEVRDASGEVVYTYAGYPLAGYSAPGLWQFDDLVADSVRLRLPEPGSYTVYAGFQEAGAELPLPATGADGSEYPDGMLPIGAFVVAEDGTISAGSGP